MKKSQRTFVFSGFVVITTLLLLSYFVLTPWMKSKRDREAKAEARRTLQILVQAEKKFAKTTGAFTDNLSSLQPLLSKLPRDERLHFGFNPECLRENGIANSIGTTASPELSSKLRAMFSELPCASRHHFTAMVAVRTSERLEIYVSASKDEVASMTLSDQTHEGATEVASFRGLLATLTRNEGSTSGMTSRGPSRD